MVFPQVKELKHIGVPRLEIDGKSARAFVSALIHVACGGIIRSEHRDDSIGIAISSGNVGAKRQGQKVADRKGRDSHPVARIQWMLNPIPPAVLLIMAQFLRVS